MSQIDISTAAILKVVFAGVFLYVVAPLLLTARDMLLLKAIDKWLLTSALSYDIRICELDRWYLNNKYQKERKVELPVFGEKTIYKLDGVEVSEEIYKNYESGLNMHQNRFRRLDAKINFKHNLIFWLTKNYKQGGFKNPIPEWREESYNQENKKNT